VQSPPSEAATSDLCDCTPTSGVTVVPPQSHLSFTISSVARIVRVPEAKGSALAFYQGCSHSESAMHLTPPALNIEDDIRLHAAGFYSCSCETDLT
jgi:hypothetical protein